MELNGIDLISYADNANESTFVLGCTMEQALKLNDSPIWTITAGEEIQKQYGSYTVVSVARDGEYVHVTAVRELSPDTQAAIQAINSDLSRLSSNTTDLQDQIDELAMAVIDLAGEI